MVHIWSKKDENLKFPIIRFSKISIIILTLGLLILGSSGAITALGDTLFPAESLAEGLIQDLNSSTHFLIQLRIYHPIIAVTMAFIIYAFIQYLRKYIRSSQGIKYANFLLAGIIGQILVGTLNVLLLAPIWMQIIHLFIADLIWLMYLLFINQILIDYS
jgi:heme A synthase